MAHFSRFSQLPPSAVVTLMGALAAEDRFEASRQGSRVRPEVHAK